MSVACAPDLPRQIKKSERNERATGNQWKQFTDTAVDRHAAPNDENPQRDCEKHVASSSHSGYRESLRPFPLLRARRDDKRQPMGRDGSV